MRVLKGSDISYVSGGIDTNGYNFSYAVGMAFMSGCVAAFWGQSYSAFRTGAAIGASFGALMMVAKVADQLVFDTPKQDHIEYIYVS